jgi:hypothetical protein
VETRSAYRVSVRRSECKRSLGRPWVRWEDNIEMDLEEVGWGSMEWIDLAWDSDRRQALTNLVLTFVFH